MNRKNNKFGIYSCFDYNILFSDFVALVKDNGFDVIALSALAYHSGYNTFCGRDRIRKVLEKNDLKLNSIHGPRGAEGLASPYEEIRKEAVEQHKMTIFAASEIADDVIVVLHLAGVEKGALFNKSVDSARQSLKILSDYALEKKVRIAMENESKVLELMIKEFNEPHMGICYDSGHANFTNNPFNLIENYGDRLFTTHINDNNGKADQHNLPGDGNLNWDKFKEIIKKIDYTGDYVLEATMKGYESISATEFLKRARKSLQDLFIQGGHE